MRTIPTNTLVNRRRRRHLSGARGARRRLGRAGMGCAAAGLVMVIGLALGLGAAYARLTENLPPVERLALLLDPSAGPLTQPTRLYDRSGTQVIYSLENPGIPRRYTYVDPARPNHFSPELVRVMVGVLEPGFWQSPGARLDRITALEPQTIAERLAERLLLDQEPPGLRRALRMRLLAAQMVAKYGRTRLLEWYLNSASFGHMAYGADSAAKLYLDREVEALSLGESVVLAAAHLAPALNPIDAPQAAREQQQQVFERLRSGRVIPAAELERARAQEIAFMTSAPESASPAQAFALEVIEQVAVRLGRDRLERGGLRIITTLDYNLQLELNCLVRAQLARLNGEPVDGVALPDGKDCQSVRLLPTLPPGAAALPSSLAASAVILDPRSGEVLALIGDTTLDGEGYRMLPHAPGSLLSPLAAVAGFSRGFSPSSLMWDIPTGPVSDLAGPQGSFHGPVRLRVALANDYLVPLAQMIDQVGALNVWQMAETLGLDGLSEPGPGGPPGADLLYGGGSVSPVDLAQAYGIFAAQGVSQGRRVRTLEALQPSTVRFVEEIAPQGAPAILLDFSRPESQAVLSPPLAYLVHHVLADATARRPSLGYPNLLEIGRPSGARVGRVSGGGQVWTAGYTPQRVMVVWTGLPEAAGAEATPSAGLALDVRSAAGVWHAMMQYMSAPLPAEDWPEPAGITRLDVCDPSGQLPTTDCPNVVSEVFLAGAEPQMLDTLYRPYEINRETGRLATVFTPPALVENRVFLVPPPEAREWAIAAGIALPPEDYDAIQPVAQPADARIDSPASFAYLSGKVNVRGTAAGEAFQFYTLQAGQGLNPRDWLQIGTESAGQSTVEDGVLGVWDTSGLEGLYAIRLMVVREDQRVEMAVIQVTVDNTAPQVRAGSPLEGEVMDPTGNQAITLRADVTDSVGVSRVVWELDGKIIAETVQAPYVLPWTPRSGRHTLTIRAYDLAGNAGDSGVISFSVQ